MTRPPRPRAPWSGPNGAGGVSVAPGHRRPLPRPMVWALWALVGCGIAASVAAIATLIIELTDPGRCGR